MGSQQRGIDQEAFTRLSVSSKRVELRRIASANLWEELPLIGAFGRNEGREETDTFTPTTEEDLESQSALHYQLNPSHPTPFPDISRTITKSKAYQPARQSKTNQTFSSLSKPLSHLSQTTTTHSSPRANTETPRAIHNNGTVSAASTSYCPRTSGTNDQEW